MDANFDIKMYRDRWKAVEEFEREELRSLSMETRLHQMITIWRMAVGLGFSFDPDNSEMDVFTRWAKIKEGK
jgi:hypothetical protein